MFGTTFKSDRRVALGRRLVFTVAVVVLVLVYPVIHTYIWQKQQPVATKSIRFHDIATSLDPVTDKVTAHGYEAIYDIYLMPTDEKIKLLEIGLGCDMGYGPGASATIWPRLFPNGDIWFAELDEECVKHYWNPSYRWHYVTGNQGDEKIVTQWINETGGQFDFIIDDGGHTNHQIWTSFAHLFFHALSPGGVYFIEDLHVGRYGGWHSNGLPHDNSSVMMDLLTDWIDQLVVNSMAGQGNEVVKRKYKHMLPREVVRIDCVKDMCAITKSKTSTET